MKKEKEQVRVMIGSGDSASFIKVNKGDRVMIGSGEDACFIEAGLTPEESRKRLDDRIDEIIKEHERAQRRESIQVKIKSIFRRK